MVDHVKPVSARLPADLFGGTGGPIVRDHAKGAGRASDGLERRGLVARRPTPAFPRGVYYSLTPAGRSLTLVLDNLELWSKGFNPPE
ncbi:winged helix-turn-helix transcriptional regulator [Cucumibacter marinus]|uniref:winged helix-turn-helix transcriptional regulator n=1 Tax=Cucumibacter marinus TaxID=1121252 RepID=UPI00055EBD56